MGEYIMKRNNGYVILVLVLLTLIYVSCDRTTPDSLRIVKINDGDPLIVDVADWGLIVDPEDPEDTILTYMTDDWIVPVEVSYVETGIGLPTYPTTYTARITDYKVQFSRIRINTTDPSWQLNSISGATNISVPSDPQGGSTVKANLKVIPKEWIQTYFDSLTQGAMVKGTLILSGYEELTRDAISDTSQFTIDFGDYYDDPRVFGGK
jgi:hypothetical protein